MSECMPALAPCFGGSPDLEIEILFSFFVEISVHNLVKFWSPLIPRAKVRGPMMRSINLAIIDLVNSDFLQYIPCPEI